MARQTPQRRASPTKAKPMAARRYPFDEEANLQYFKLWRKKNCQVSMNKLFTNFSTIIDGVIGHFVQIGFLWEDEWEDYKQEAHVRILQQLQFFDPSRGSKLYSFIYSTVATHIRLFHWNEMRRNSRCDYIPEERTLEVLMGGNEFTPHVGLDLRSFCEEAYNRIRCQYLPFEGTTGGWIKIYMLRLLANQHLDRSIKLTQFHKELGTVRYRTLITNLLEKHFPDGNDSYYNLFRNFFK